MSKIGKKPILVPEGTIAVLKDGSLEIKGKNATKIVKLLPGVNAKIEDGEKNKQILLTADSRTKQAVSNWGTTSAHIKNAIAGSMADFSKELLIVGIGFKAAIERKNLVLSLGFSHQVKFPIPENIKIILEKSIIKVSGSDKWLVGETAAKIRDLKRPEPYQGKGIRYKDEIVRKKAGKKAAAAAGPATK